MTGFKFKIESKPDTPDYPFSGANGYSNTVGNSYSTKLYLPSCVFLITFEFDCLKASEDVLPKMNAKYIISEEDVVIYKKTKSFFHSTKEEIIPVKRKTWQNAFEVADLSLTEYLKQYGSDLKEVTKFLELYMFWTRHDLIVPGPVSEPEPARDSIRAIY